MCGIVGIRRFDGGSVDVELLRSMTDLLEHRGPDGQGHWTEGPIGFGHRRLSIIDLAGSPQPMSSVDGTCHLTFNGEILNFKSLRQRFSYPYRTEGDTETILATFLSLGSSGFSALEGQFAFALFDSRDGSMWLARDRMGILPLYYYSDERIFAFASEIKALVPAIPCFQPDLASLDAYLTRGSVPAPYTLFKGVRKLPAASLVRIGSRTIDPPVRYWTIPKQTKIACSTSEAADRLDSALTDAVSSALVADVPVGAYLSGGVDSSLIVALVAKLRGGAGVETFSAGFGDHQHDELPFAREVSQLLGTQHHEVLVAPEDFMSLWHSLTWHRDGPVSQPADMAVFRLAQLAKRSVSVVLSGEGSDELFAGYPKHRYAGLTTGLGVIPKAVRSFAASALTPLASGRAGRLRPALRVLQGIDEAERLSAWFAPFSLEERAELLGQLQKVQHPRPIPSEGGDALRRMLATDLETWLPDNLLERGDRMSMAASLELRPPFLDRNVVELAFQFPSALKIKNGRSKYLVKDVARRYLPSRIVDRKKVGFKVPLDNWFRNGLESFAWDKLTSARSFASNHLEISTVRELLRKHRDGKSDRSFQIWNLLSLEVWNEVFFCTENHLSPLKLRTQR